MLDTVLHKLLYKLVPHEFILIKHSSKSKVVILWEQSAFVH